MTSVPPSISPSVSSLCCRTLSRTSPPSSLKNVIYKIPCGDCHQFYIGQTSRPLIKRIKEHEACMRLDSHTDSSTGNIKSAPAKHGREHGHAINWKATSILTTSEFKGQLNLLEHAAITTLKPGMNIQHKGMNSCWAPSFPRSLPASMTFPPTWKYESLPACFCHFCVIWCILLVTAC